MKILSVSPQQLAVITLFWSQQHLAMLKYFIISREKQKAKKKSMIEGFVVSPENFEVASRCWDKKALRELKLYICQMLCTIVLTLCMVLIMESSSNNVAFLVVGCFLYWDEGEESADGVSLPTRKVLSCESEAFIACSSFSSPFLSTWLSAHRL